MLAKSAIKDAVLRRCIQNGVVLTPLREEVLDLILSYDGIVKAYSVLNEMQKVRGQVAPPTVYRALDFWVEQGVLHKIAAVNGYLLCQHEYDVQPHEAMILLCTLCGTVKECRSMQELEQLKAALVQQGFMFTAEHLVLTGVCQVCQKN